jgi:hypothetical protein
MFIFTFTVPNCAKHPKMFPLTFIACIVWLGILVEVMVEHASVRKTNERCHHHHHHLSF